MPRSRCGLLAHAFLPVRDAVAFLESDYPPSHFAFFPFFIVIAGFL
jgi:hypothetical protein